MTRRDPRSYYIVVVVGCFLVVGSHIQFSFNSSVSLHNSTHSVLASRAYNVRPLRAYIIYPQNARVWCGDHVDRVYLRSILKQAQGATRRAQISGTAIHTHDDDGDRKLCVKGDVCVYMM